MELKYAHLADYAAADSGGKLTIVGLFDQIYDRSGSRPITFPPFYMVAVFESHVTEGSEHEVKIVLVSSDGDAVGPKLEGGIKFQSGGPGKPLRGQLIAGFGPGLVKVPDTGDYEFSFLIDKRHVGSLAVSVVPAPGR